MIDTRTREKLEFRLQEAARGYTKAKMRMQHLKDETITKVRDAQVNGLEVVELLDQMCSDIDVYESDMNFYKKDFEEAKSEYIELINKLKIDWT